MLRSNALLPALAHIAGRPLTVTALRAVPLKPFVAYVQREGRPNLRFMSGARNRHNLADTPCLYVAEEDETARIELRHGFDGIPVDEAIFHVKCELTRILDLTDAAVCAPLRLTEANLFAPWETAKRPTATQRLGELVLRSGRFDAIRFPSNAMHAVGKTGVNLVIAEAAALDPAKVTVACHAKRERNLSLPMDIYEKLGVRTIINARGMKTRFGGAIMLPAVVDAMVAASRSSVYMTELQDVIGARIAAMTGNEAAIVTGGAASGIVLAIAACMTGDDRKKMASLPDTSLLNNEVIVQRNLRFDEDCALKQTGARIIEISEAGSQGVAELEAAIGPRTAAIFTTNGTGPRAIPLSSVVPVARRHGVPVVVDDACGLPPAENLWKFTREMGADLAIFSGGKGLRGPQSSGLVVGTKRLVDAMKMQASPRCYIGRSMKVGKEEMVGLYTAIECLFALPDRDRHDLYEKRRLHIEARLRHLRFLRFQHEGGRLTITWDEETRSATAEEVAARMRSGKPAIECGCSEGLHLDVESLQAGEEEIVAARLAEIMSS